MFRIEEQYQREMRQRLGNSEQKPATIGHGSRSASASSSERAAGNTGPGYSQQIRSFLRSNCNWIPQNWTRSKIKTTLRCAIVGWLSTILFVIPSVQVVLGQVSVPVSFYFPLRFMEYLDIVRLASWSSLVNAILIADLHVSYEFSCFFLPAKRSFLISPRTRGSDFDICGNRMGVRLVFLSSPG